MHTVMLDITRYIKAADNELYIHGPSNKKNRKHECVYFFDVNAAASRVFFFFPEHPLSRLMSFLFVRVLNSISLG